MRRDLRQVEDDLGGIGSIGIRARRILDPILEVALGETLDALGLQAPENSLKVSCRI